MISRESKIMALHAVEFESEHRVSAMELWEPDIVVAVDFGMTCTGVAYSMGPDWPDPKAIQNWPGMTGVELRNKVATAVGYNSKTEALQSWGLLVDAADPDTTFQELFKLFLDPAYQGEIRGAVSVQEARQWYHDYLSCLYKYIKQFFHDSFPRWQSQNVEYLFSTPTTWRSPAMIADIERIIRKAGFAEQPNSRVIMSLTEAEAAAVYASKQQFQKGDVILVCDAGGGTTDLNVLRMRGSEIRKAELEPLSWVEGATVGSTLIDYRVEKIITKRLQSIRKQIQGEPEECAMEMMRGRFEPFKRSFGSAVASYPALYLQVPGLGPGVDLPEASVTDSRMAITREEMQGVFDEQISKIFRLIDEQIERLYKSRPGEPINYLVLSGGFGSSPYLRDQVRQKYEVGMAGIKVLVAADPQLAVTFGMVMDRVQELNKGSTVYKERKARNSYGIVCRLPYHPEIHFGEPVIEDARDNIQWADRQIHWLIQQGQTVSVTEGVQKTFDLKLPPGEEELPWHTEFIMSSLPVARLPRSMRYTGVEPVCTVEAMLGPTDMKLKNKHWWQPGQKFYKAQFTVKVDIGPADLKFQLWNKYGEKCNKDHDRVNVHWDLHHSEQ